MSPSANGPVDVAVIGGGIVGLAAARAVLLREPDARLEVLEKEPLIATHQTSRNSGVVHAGIYYKPGSLKATLCVEGRERTKAYATEKGIPYRECGKVVVALKDDEIPRLDELHRRAILNNVPGIARLDPTGIREIEPAVRGVAALHSPATAITDFAAIARAYARDIESWGGTVRCRFNVVGITQDADSVTIVSSSGQKLRAGRVMICAGLYVDKLAAVAGDAAEPYVVPFRGDYFRLSDDLAKTVRGLVYPVPDPDLPFLGLHLTRTINGDVLVGPNAILAGAREGYDWRRLDLRELAGTLGAAGFWRFASRYWRVGMAEAWRASSKRRFAADAAAYLPGVRSRNLERAPSGVRAQAIDSAGRLVEDFSISRLGLVTSVRNAPSPAATSSMPIGDRLAEMLLQ